MVLPPPPLPIEHPAAQLPWKQLFVIVESSDRPPRMLSISISLNVFSDSWISLILLIILRFGYFYYQDSNRCPFFHTVSRSKNPFINERSVGCCCTAYSLLHFAFSRLLFPLFRYIMFRSTNQTPETTLFTVLNRLVSIIIIKLQHSLRGGLYWSLQ